jgi:hypothetical protein
VLYHLPYHGKVSIIQPVLHSVNEVALKVPESLRFDANVPGIFRNQGEQNGLSTYVVDGAHSGQSLSFSLSPAILDAGKDGKAAARGQGGMQFYDAAFAMQLGRNLIGASRPAPLQANKHVSGWTLLIGVLVGALFLVSFFFAKNYRSSVPADRNFNAA